MSSLIPRPRAGAVTDLKRRLLRNRAVRVGRSGVDLAALFATLSRSALVDPDLYARQRGSKTSGKSRAVAHWLLEGADTGLLLGPLLLPMTPVREDVTGFAASLRRASRLRRTQFPAATNHPLIDAGWYADQHPEAATWAGGPLAYWTAVGRAAGHLTHPLLSDPIDLTALAEEVVGEQPTAEGRHPDGTPAGLVIIGSAWPIGADTLTAVTGAVGTTLVVGVDTSASGRLVTAALACLPSYVHAPSILAALAALAAADADADADAEIVVIAGAPVEVRPEVVTALVAALGADPAAVAAGPVVLSADGVVAAAGLSVAGGRSDPLRAGLSPDDIARDGSPRAVDALPTDLLAVRRGALAGAAAAVDEATGGTETLEDAAIADILSGLIAPLAASGRLLLVPDVTVRRSQQHAADVRSVAAPRPIQVAEAPPRLRWAIKSPHPAGTAGLAWGDLHFARGLAEALERLGQFAVVDPLDAWTRPSADQDDIAVVLRGLHHYTRVPEQTTVLWVISHPELVDDGELADADLTYAASVSWSAAARVRGLPVQPLLQCSDAARFAPDAGPLGGGPGVLFVGNTRKARRPIVEMAMAAHLGLQVVGAGWSDRLPSSALLADHVDNEALPALYRSAGVVLNDHWPHMAELGFLSNRLFDLTGCGATWISDEATDLHEVFGDVARTISTAAELAAMVRGSDWPSPEDRLAAATRIRADHSFDARARTLVDDVAALRTSRG